MDYEYSGTRWMCRWASQIAVARAKPHGTCICALFGLFVFVFFFKVPVRVIETTVHRVFAIFVVLVLYQIYIWRLGRQGRENGEEEFLVRCRVVVSEGRQ